MRDAFLWACFSILSVLLGFSCHTEDEVHSDDPLAGCVEFQDERGVTMYDCNIPESPVLLGVERVER